MNENIEFANLREATEWLIRRSLPEFLERREGDVQRKGKRVFDLRCLRKDNLWERLFIQFELERPILAIQFAVNFFRDCPTIACPFGYEADIVDIAQGEQEQALRKSLAFSGWIWIKGELTNNNPMLQLLQDFLGKGIRSVMELWAKTLLNESIPRRAVEIYYEMEPEFRGGDKFGHLADLSELESAFYDRIIALGDRSVHLNPAPGDWITANYTTRKMAWQLIYRLRGERNWYLR
jgi:hypothetical protein